MQLLHIDSAITGSNSVSRQLTAQVVAAWTAAHPGTQVDYLDLVANAPATSPWKPWPRAPGRPKA